MTGSVLISKIFSLGGEDTVEHDMLKFFEISNVLYKTISV